MRLRVLNELTQEVELFTDRLIEAKARQLVEPSAEPEPEFEHRSPEEIERIVRRWDWLVAGGTGVVTVLVVTIGLYDDHTFGTYADYAKAFALGFLGQLTVPLAWQLFPMFRSLVAARPKGG